MKNRSTPPNIPLATQSHLLRLAQVVCATPDETDEWDDAFNAFTESARAAMTDSQRDDHDAWCHKATQREIMTEALRILGITTVLPEQTIRREQD
jgi:hypothetical protein